MKTSENGIGFDHSKMNKILEQLNTMNYKLEGDEELLVSLVKIENPNLSFSSSLGPFCEVCRLLEKYIKAKIRMCYNILKFRLDPSMKAYFFASASLSHLLSGNGQNATDKDIKKIIIVIPDKGYPVGLCSRTSLIFGGVKSGSMLEYIDIAQKFNDPIILLNPNPKNETYPDFDEYLTQFWENFIKTKLKSITEIIVISHKNSGISLIKLLNKNGEDFKTRVQKIILINSGHNSMYEIFPTDLCMEFELKATNYITSCEPVGTLLYSSSESMDGCENRSCGTSQEELSHYYISGEISKFLK